MRIRVDRPRCVAHGQCNMVSEELFPLDADGYSAIPDAGEPISADDEDDAEAGVYNCPAQALSMEK